MKKKMLYVENPASGAGVDRNSIRSQLQEMLHDGHFQVLKTTGEDDMGPLQDALQSQKWDAVIIGGGDGTINMVAGAAGELDIPMGVIPAGSANGLAACLGIRSVDDAIKAIRKGTTTSLDALEINGQLCLHMADFGFNAGVVKRFSQGGERGMMAYFKSSLDEFLEMRPYSFLVEIEGQAEEIEAKMLVIANGDRYGTGAVINPGGSLHDGKFEIIAMTPDGLDEMISLSVALFRETIRESPVVKTWSASQANISNPGGATFQVDGEVVPDTAAVKIRCLPQRYTFFVPE
jgi:diacylglycerol kinase (ATP)